MGKVAWLFPGQGSQRVGMGAALAAFHPEARRVLEEADEALGFPLSTLMAEGPEATLRLTEHAQPALLTHSIMALRAFQSHLPRPDFVAGHSLGEYSALVACGALDFKDAVRAVRDRGRFMQEAVPAGQGAMAAILGMPPDGLETACAMARERTGKVVVVANHNGPGQVVISGHREAVAEAQDLLEAMGCPGMAELPVSAPFHSPLMEPARARMEPVLRALPFREPACPLVNNVDAAMVSDPERLREGLLRQVCAPVRWEAGVALLLRQGVDTFLELGSGKVLAGLLTRQAKAEGLAVRVNSLGAPEDLIHGNAPAPAPTRP